MVSVSRLAVVFSKSNVCFGGVIVAPGDGGNNNNKTCNC